MTDDRRLAPHIQDQIDAATRENQEFLRLFGATGQAKVGMVKAGQDKNLDDLMMRVTNAIAADAHRACPHLANPTQTFVRAWDTPIHLRCAKCESKDPFPTGDEEFRCDSCGRVDRKTLQASRVEVGPFIVSFARCGDCRP